ncbi:MAG: hypothetical protein QXD48_01955 [Candidatus Aenigmatarchaeota archaeon]
MSVIAFCIFIIALDIMPTLHKTSILEDSKSRAYQISEYLIFSEGEPKNWNKFNVKALGLSSGDFYILDINKINNLRNLCSTNYERVKEFLGQDYKTDIIMNMTYIDGSILFSCTPKVKTRLRSESSISRAAVVDISGIKYIVKFNVGVII